MTKISGACFVFLLPFMLFGCQTAPENTPEISNISNNRAQTSAPPPAAIKSEQTLPLEVPKLANKPIAGLDEIFGAPLESKPLEKGGEYRLYKIAGQSKGLAVRFYAGRAKSFNLILDKPVSTSKEALKQVFGIDVGNSGPVKDAKEPLSEKYQGTFGGVKFTKVSAKKQADGRGFIFVLAEVAE